MKNLNSFDEIYMGFAQGISVKSKANRKKVGACIVTKNGVTLSGYNGTPSTWDNACEDENGVTKPEVIHAELNCVLKAAREGVSLTDSTCYVTLAPCVQCAAMLFQSGVKRVVYKEDYRDMQGVELLKQHGVEVIKLKTDYEKTLDIIKELNKKFNKVAIQPLNENERTQDDLTQSSPVKLTYEQWREANVPNWRRVPSSGWNDPNEGWYYHYMNYLKTL